MPREAFFTTLCRLCGLFLQHCADCVAFFYNTVHSADCAVFFFTSQHVPPRLIPASPSQGESKGTPCLEEAKALDPRPARQPTAMGCLLVLHQRQIQISKFLPDEGPIPKRKQEVALNLFTLHSLASLTTPAPAAPSRRRRRSQGWWRCFESSHCSLSLPQTSNPQRKLVGWAAGLVGLHGIVLFPEGLGDAAVGGAATTRRRRKGGGVGRRHAAQGGGAAVERG
jgi:hypothetical protein